MVLNHIFMVIYLVWGSTRNSKSACVRPPGPVLNVSQLIFKFILDFLRKLTTKKNEKVSEVKQKLSETCIRRFHGRIYGEIRQIIAQYMVQNPYIWYATEYLVYGRIYGIWPYIWPKNCHIYGYGHITKKSGMVDL